MKHYIKFALAFLLAFALQAIAAPVQTVNILTFGAKCDGTTDDTTAIQNAINFAPTGSTVLIPSGGCKYAGGITITKGLILSGGGYNSQLVISSATADGITITLADVGVTIKDFRFDSSVTRTAGSYIVVNGSGTSNKYSKFDNLILTNGYNGITFNSAAYWKISGCSILANANVGVTVQNTITPDEGDSVIAETVFSNAGTTGDLIVYNSSSGLKISASKFLKGNRGLVLNSPTATNLGTLVISGNSFENQNTQNIYMTPSGTGTWARVTIDGNEFLAIDNTAAIDIEAGMNLVEINGNAFDLRSSTAGTRYGIYSNATDTVLIGHNGFKATVTAGTLNAINIVGAGFHFLSNNQFTSGFTNNFITGTNTLVLGPAGNVPGFTVYTAGGKQFEITDTSTAVNWARITGNTTGNGPVISAQGETNTSLMLTSKGTQLLNLATNSGTIQAQVLHTASANNILTFTGSNGGNPTISTNAGNVAITPAVVGASTLSGTQLISTIATGTAPLSVASTTNVANLNASSLGGATFAAPGAIGGGTASAGTFTTVNASGTITGSNSVSFIAPANGSIRTSAGALFIDTGDANPIVFRPNFGEAGRFSTTGLGVTGTLTTTGKLTNYNNIATVTNGVPSLLATIDSTGLTGNVGATTLYSVPSNGAGIYRISSLTVETTAGSLSSTLPNVQIVYTDQDTGGSITIDATPILGVAGIGQTGALSANMVGTTATGVIVINAKASTTIQYQTVNYASNLAGMAYALHIRLEAL